jgi:hypothetical protein
MMISCERALWNINIDGKQVFVFFSIGKNTTEVVLAL